MEPPIEGILTRYAARQTTPEEEQLLVRAAMEDQETFDALMNDEILRVLLDDPVSQSVLVQATVPESTTAQPAAPEPWWRTALASVSAFVGRPWMVWGAAGAVAAAVLVAILVNAPDKTSSLMAMNVVPASTERAFTDLAAARRIGPVTVELQLDRTTYRQGDDMRITLRCSQDAELILIAHREGESARVLYPNQWHQSAATPAGDVAVPPSGTKLRIDSPPGRLTFIAAAFPEGSRAAEAVESGRPLPEALAVASVDVEVLPK
jgi:hypothetical protein